MSLVDSFFCGVWLQAALEVDFAKIEIDIFFFEWGLNSSYYTVCIIWENVMVTMKVGKTLQMDIIEGWGNLVFAIFED